jgi:glycyl-tRNA synthetase beta chain
MNKQDDFLVEVQTEELPPKSLLALGKAFSKQIQEQLQKSELTYQKIKFFATPRRLAILITQLLANQPNQMIERRGPARLAAFDLEGRPTRACIGFARSCEVAPEALITIKNSQGEWVGYHQIIPGKSVAELMPVLVEQALINLPMPKRMRWGSGNTSFIRPIHSIVMLYGDQVIEGMILGFNTGRVTHGHRFLAPGAITIPHAAAYESLLATEGFVIADFELRREKIKEQAVQILKDKIATAGKVVFSTQADDLELLNEVTGLVEWPIALCGQIDPQFLAMPKEVLVSSMQDHQRYFPVVDSQSQDKLLPYFVMISNVPALEENRVIQGNERVLRARLADAAFFYDADKKENLEHRIDHLKGIIFQARLGTLYDKAERLSKLAAMVAITMKINSIKALREKMLVETEAIYASRAGWLAKTDLTTHMVSEFPELQGIMGYYYALHDEESESVAIALKEQYMPRFSGDHLPNHSVGQALALADRIDTLVGAFGINQQPTGDKDPYGLRRAAVGIIRILIENKIDMDLNEAIAFAISCYTFKLDNKETMLHILNFILERLRSWYIEQKHVSADVFASVAALNITNPLDIDRRIQAVRAFKNLAEAKALSIANKRVSNILAKYEEVIEHKEINHDFFESLPEKELARQLEEKSKAIEHLYPLQKYENILIQLAELHQPIDDFFEQVMVMTEDKLRRENRILLLQHLRKLFTKVADIALLQ